MTQFQHTLKQLLTGEKTETSRIVKEGQEYAGALPHAIPLVYQWDKNVNYTRTIWQIGKDYAIVPRRGVHSVGRYRVEAIWRQDVRTLLLGQVDAEGFSGDWLGFWRVWCTMHDKEGLKFFADTFNRPLAAPLVKKYLQLRPDERYQAWRMAIRVLWETVDWEAPAVRALQIEPYDDTIKDKF